MSDEQTDGERQSYNGNTSRSKNPNKIEHQ